jgi:hypothetical protein
MKYGVNKINIKLFTQQVWWLDDKGIELHPWGPFVVQGSNFTNDIHYGQQWNID